MGNCVSLSLPLDHSVNKFSQWLGEKGGYISNLKKNLVALEKTMEELKAKRDDLSRRLKREEDRGLQRLAEFQVWLNRVEAVEKEVNTLLIDRDVELQRLCLCGFCSKSFMSSHRYGKNVVLTLKEVEKLKCSGVFDVIAEKALTSEVEERPLKPTIVGQETMLEKAWKHLMEDRVGVMGMYGMGGVGKTTLLTQINNKFGKDRCGFDLVIWVVVSKEFHVEKIQDEINQKVDLGEAQWNQKDKIQKAVHLYNFLRKKKFVLFLDDIWEKVDLAEIGVPFPTRQNQCKVAFTTRSHDVCARMGVDYPIEVKCLMDNDALYLFQKRVGQITLGSDPEIPNLVKIIAKKCCGLPLALNVIGETMSCKRTIQEWRNAIDVLNSYAAEFSGMEDKILPLLKYSYDNLKREQVKSCLLYCALFPEDHIISKCGLIEYWICEGIIDESEGMERAKNQGYEIIGSLIHASLLMEEEKNALHEVYMHDVVREMALWITSDFGKQKNHFIVRAGAGIYDIPKVKNWNGVRRISLMSNKIDRISGSLECLELTTLFLQRNKTLVYISDEFFRSMPRLVVLYLSHNKNLCELPDGMSELVSLRYLNMSWTRIQCLPVGLLELKNLLHLNLEWTGKLLSIVGISALLNLKVLKLRGSRVRDNPNTVDELQLLEHLELLTIEISYNSGLVQFLSSHKLMFCTQALEISGLQLESTDISLLASMEKVYKLVFDGCTLSDIKMDIASIRCACFLSLSKIYLSSCKYLKELTWLMFAPNLTKLFVEGAYELEDIINKEKACVREESGLVLFQKLEILHLANLPEVKNIYWRPLPFPCLSDMIVLDCPKRRKLPLNSRSGSGGGDKQLVIKCREREWIKRVEWEDEATKARFVTLIP